MAINKIKYWLVLLLLAYIPTWLSHKICFYYWNETKRNTQITSFESILTIVLIPIFLAIVVFILSLKLKVQPTKFFFLNAIVIISCIWLSAKLHFLNWVKSIGSISNLDNDTIEVIGLERILGYIISIICLLIVYWVLKSKFKTKVSR
jgi:hypothetical protein